MLIGQCVHHMFCDPALGVEERERYLVQTLPVDVMSLWLHNVHYMSKERLFEEGLFVLLVADVLHHGVLFHALGLLNALSTGLKNAVHLGAQANIFCNWEPGALILHLAQHLLVHHAVERVVVWVCLSTHPQSGSRGAASMYLYIGADGALNTETSSDCKRSRTLDA